MKHEWEKYFYPFPKTERMVYYNKVVKDICETDLSSFKTSNLYQRAIVISMGHKS